MPRAARAIVLVTATGVLLGAAGARGAVVARRARTRARSARLPHTAVSPGVAWPSARRRCLAGATVAASRALRGVRAGAGGAVVSRGAVAGACRAGLALSTVPAGVAVAAASAAAVGGAGAVLASGALGATTGAAGAVVARAARVAAGLALGTLVSAGAAVAARRLAGVGLILARSALVARACSAGWQGETTAQAVSTQQAQQPSTRVGRLHSATPHSAHNVLVRTFLVPPSLAWNTESMT